MYKKILPVFVFVLFMLPMAVFAALDIEITKGYEGLLTCAGPNCSACDLLNTGGEVLKFLIGIGWAIAAIGFAVAGFKLVTSAGNEGQVTAAKGLFSNVLIGFIILLAAWLIVDTVLEILTGDGLLGWQAKVC